MPLLARHSHVGTGFLAALALSLLMGLLSAGSAGADDAAAIRRGERLFAAAGCAGCHTDVKNRGPLAAGGRALSTPFGTFYGPNITPDPVQGVGQWSEADFIRALREGVAPDGSHYFPVFPYTSFTRMTEADLRDLFAYLRSLPPEAKPNRPHEIAFPFNLRFLQYFWKRLFFTPGPLALDASQSPEVRRGAYLVEALGHCGECHTPRNIFGAVRRELALGGTRDGPEGAKVPNITPDRATGLGGWSDGDIAELLASGMTPEGDFVGATMAEVVRHSTSKLTPADIEAVVAYLRTIPPVVNDLTGRR